MRNAPPVAAFHFAALSATLAQAAHFVHVASVYTGRGWVKVDLECQECGDLSPLVLDCYPVGDGYPPDVHYKVDACPVCLTPTTEADARRAYEMWVEAQADAYGEAMADNAASAREARGGW